MPSPVDCDVPAWVIRLRPATWFVPSQAADELHSMRSAAGVLEADELPITDYDALNVSDAVAAHQGTHHSRGRPRDPGLRGGAQKPPGRRFRRPNTRRGHRTRGRGHRLNQRARSPVPSLGYRCEVCPRVRRHPPCRHRFRPCCVGTRSRVNCGLLIRLLVHT